MDLIKTDILIIGAGVNGLLTAYNLVEHGVKDIVIVEKNYPGSGGTFRCATGIRASFTSLEHITVMKRAIELWRELSEKLGFEYRRDGYLWLISNEKDYEFFRKAVEFQNLNGVNTRFVDIYEIKEIVPYMNLDKVIAGVYDPLAGKADNFAIVTNTLKYLASRGVRVMDYTETLRIMVKNGRACSVETNRGLIEANTIVVACGWDSPQLLSTIGLEVPITNIPKHALITEAYKYSIKPLLIDWSSSSYLVQVFHGGILIGAEMETKYGGRVVNKIEYLYRATSIWLKHFPWLANLNILRYWTGYYDTTPDHHPIIGPVDDYENLYLAIGFSGHGFMMAPAVGEALTQYIVYGKPLNDIFEKFRLERFRKGELIKEIAVFG